MSTPSAEKANNFTVFLEGHEGHQGNVLGRAYVTKLSKLLTVMAKMERAFLDGGNKKTDFEIIEANKYNPTTITFKPVPTAKNYNPIPAFDWGLKQIGMIGRGERPDSKVKIGVVKDVAELSKGSGDLSYKNFWINGQTDPIQFDDRFHINALIVADEMAKEESKTVWFSGVSRGEVVGTLEKIDNLDADQEFFIVPPVGAERIRCKFPESMKDELGNFAFKMVKVHGDIHYSATSPHPEMIVLLSGGISEVVARQKEKKLRDLRGIFKGARRNHLNLEIEFGL
tara:strand:+ start:8085 stop:8936 length:852 start_codon:yes stop_codon:yes gene_type:complete